MMASRVQPGGRLTAAIKGQFQPILTASIAAIIRDRVNDRLTTALNVSNPASIPVAEGQSDDMSDPTDGVLTTDDEIAGFRIVQAIIARHVDPKRIVIRDSKSYCAILLDDNNRKTVARLHFNSITTRYLGTFSGKIETRHTIIELTDIYKLESAIVARLEELLRGKEVLD
jgi:hypothetical protein